MVTYIPRTTHLRRTRFEVPHRAAGFDPGAFDAQGIGSIPEVKLERRLGVLDPTLVEQVDLKRWLALV